MKWKRYERVIVITAVIMIIGWLFTNEARADTDVWSVEQGYITTSPEGDKLACKLGYWTEEFAPDEVSLLCVPFDNPQRYKGYEDGELELMP